MENGNFKAGTIYKAINFTDSRSEYLYRVVKRTAKTVTLQEMVDLKEDAKCSPITKRIKLCDNIETCMDGHNVYIKSDCVK